MRYLGFTYDAYGDCVGIGLELDENGAIANVLTQAPTERNDEDVRGLLIIPGLVDIHCHGGGGASFPDDLEPEKLADAIAAHRRRGTTALVASLVSLIDPLPAIHALVPLCEAGELAGIHMEGPYISPHKAGAQNPAAIRGADLAELESWLEAGRGWIRTMTIAPEAENASEAARLLLRYGAKPSWGHTSASGELTAQRLEETFAYAEEIGFGGVPQTATHLFNAMPPLGHRAPGPVREFIQAARRGQVCVEMIADGIHLSPDLVEDVTGYISTEELAGDVDSDCLLDPELSLAYVTDAMAAAGMPEGAYQLGGLAVEVKDGAAKLAGTDTIAGGCSRLFDQFQFLLQRGNVELPQVIRSCVGAPAHAAFGGGNHYPAGLTLEYEEGEKPNFLVLDEDFEILAIVREGKRIA